MKKLFAILSALVLILSLSFSFAATPKVVVVHNSKELFRAIKSNTTIKLAEGEYNTADIAKTSNAFYNTMYSGEYSVKGATLKNLKNVRIYAETSALIYTDKEEDGISSDCVLILSNCSNIKFENISFGHKSKDPKSVLACDAGVLAINSCKDVKITNCDLFGCGFVGICAERSSSIVVKDSIIRECAASAFWLTKCKKVSFVNTEMFKNGIKDDYYKLATPWDSDVLLSKCSIHDNGASPYLTTNVSYMFDGGGSDIVVDQCTFENNHY